MNKTIRSIEQFELKDKNVFLRLDLNVPLKDGNISDETRIRASLPTLRYALDKGAKLVVASHLGRPEGKPGDRVKFSLEPVAKRLGELLDVEVILVEEPSSDAPKALLKTLRAGEMLLLENLRFDEGETENSQELSVKWASYTDIYINDAFGASHRAHASIVGLPQMVKQKGYGFLMKKELDSLDRLLKNPERPYVAILGGAKVSDKIGVIENLIDRVDSFIIGGAMAYTFLQAQNIPVGASRVEKEKVKFAGELIERVKARNKNFLLPVDHLIVESLEKPQSAKITKGTPIESGWLGVDIGPKTMELYKQEVLKAKTVFWNGPMGIFETPEFAKGTNSLAEVLTHVTGFTVVGGGDSAAAAEASGFADKMSHISTGGGASLEYLQGDVLPGVEALKS